MADDRTPRTISLTECPPDEDTPRARKRASDGDDDRRHVRLDHDAVVAGERRAAEKAAEERPSSKLT